ncbi:MAG: histidine phosphatase family protein [Woeseiaceae bacterium]
MEIILLRHGKPILPSLKKINAFSFLNWIESYSSSSLCSTSLPSKKALSAANKCNAIVCSELLRSIESAKLLNVKNITLTHSCFNEAGLPNASWRGLKLSPNVWAIIFRILWLFGYSKNSESFKEAKLRAKVSAKKLIELAEEHKNVLFVGHGIFNKLLARQLISLGWSGSRNPSSQHWGFGVYEK